MSLRLCCVKNKKSRLISLICRLKQYKPRSINLYLTILFRGRGQPVMRQAACSGSLPPRWVTKNFSACGVINHRATCSPRLTRAKGTIARRRRPPRLASCACASPRLAAAHTHARALASPAFATAKQPSTRVSNREPKAPDSNRERFNHRRWRFLQRQ